MDYDGIFSRQLRHTQSLTIWLVAPMMAIFMAWGVGYE
jgi:hypothetical protein